MKRGFQSSGVDVATGTPQAFGALLRDKPLHADTLAGLEAEYAGAFVLVTSRRDGKMMTGSVVQTDAGLGIRGLRRVRGGDDLLARLGIDEADAVG